MKTLQITLLSLLLLGSAAGAALAQTSISAGIHIGPSGRASVDLGFFYDDLAPYGNWIERPSYGWVWTPANVAATWQPYQDGHWVWTDQGWTWVSDEPYGWATYHYGRWYDDPELGWVWVPGDEWGPAWVSWQEGADYIGWAPLPPSVTLNFGGVLSVTLAPETYVFVPERYFLAPRIRTYIVPRTRVVNIYRETRNITIYRQVNNYVYNAGVRVDRIQRVVGRPVPHYHIADSRSARGTRVQGNQVTLFRPQVQRANVPPPPQRPAARRAVVDANQFQQRHPERARRAAEAQGAVQPGTQPQPTPTRRNRTVQGEQTQGAKPAKPQVQPEATPPARQRRTAPPPKEQTPPPAARPRRERPPATEQTPPPAARERQQRQRPPEEATPPQRQPRQRQVEPQQQRQERQQPPPQNQRQKNEERNQEKKDKKHQEQTPPPPPPSR